MDINLAYLIIAAIGIIVILFGFYGSPNVIPLCICMVLVGWVFTGMAEINEKGDEAMSAKLLDPLANILAAITGMEGTKRSVSPCPPERNLGQYGGSARYDGILIEGSPEFVSRVVTALDRLYHTSGYRYAKEIRLIEEANLSPGRWAQISGRHALITPRAAARSCTFLAGTITHEGAHVIYGSDHGPVYAVQARALREMGEPDAAQHALRMARNSY